MRRNLLLKTMLLLCAIVFGTSSSWADETGTINFGSAAGSTNVNAESVNGNDSQGNTWTVTTAGTTSFTPNADYAQIGSSKAAATSITFTTTLANDVNITSFSAKFGGFSGTAGTVTLKVGETTVGTGSLNATNDVTVSNTSSATGKVLTVTVTGISKGVKAYYISYTYTPAYTINAQSNNTEWGTVSKSGNVITGSPKTGYRYADPAYSISPANSATVVQSGDEFTVTPTADTEVTINFEAIPTYTVTLGDDQSTLTEATGGAGVTLPTRSAIGEYTFAGWSATNVSTKTTDAPTIIPAGTYKPTANITLYPVYTKTEGATQESASVTISQYASTHSWTNATQYPTVTLDDNITATADGESNTGKYYNSSEWRIYQNETPTVTIATTTGTLTDVTFTFTVANTGTLKYGNNVITSGTAVDVSGSTSAEFTVGNSGTATNGQVKITAISVNYTVGGTTCYWSSPVVAVATPVIDVEDNPFLFSTTATITCETAGATIKYSYDGENWSDYTAALTITETKTIYAKAIKGTDESTVAQVTATKNLAEPTVTVSGDLTLDLDGQTNVDAGTLTAAVTYNNVAVEGATVTWSGNNDAVATIDASTGAVTIKTTGEVTFTATYAGNSDYAEATGTKTVTVTDSKAPVVANFTWDLSTNSYDEITDPDIVTWSGNYATMTNSSKSGGTSASNYLGGDSNNRKSSRFYGSNTLTITPANGSIDKIVFTATSDSYASALEGSTWTNATAAVEGTTVTVTPTNGALPISATIGGTCGFTAVKVYYVATAVPVTIPANKEWITFCSPYNLDFTSDIAGLEGAYTITAHADKAITLTATKMEGKVKAGTGLLLRAAAVSATDAQAINIPVAATGEEQTDNMLKGVTEDTEIAPTTGEYTNLGLKDGEFHPYTNGPSDMAKLKAGKAYLQVPTAQMPTGGNNARLYIVLDGEATGIANVDVNANDNFDNAPMYNLAGQRVTKSYKGVVIVNGKKYINK